MQIEVLVAIVGGGGTVLGAGIAGGIAALSEKAQRKAAKETLASTQRHELTRMRAERSWDATQDMLRRVIVFADESRNLFVHDRWEAGFEELMRQSQRMGGELGHEVAMRGSDELQGAYLALCRALQAAMSLGTEELVAARDQQEQAQHWNSLGLQDERNRADRAVRRHQQAFWDKIVPALAADGPLSTAGDELMKAVRAEARS